MFVDAVQWSGLESDLAKMFAFIGDFSKLPGPGVGYTPPSGELTIPTLHGDTIAQPSDYVLRVMGEFYACGADIFETTYDAVDDEMGKP